MQHYAAFRLGLHCLQKLFEYSGLIKKKTIQLRSAWFETKQVQYFTILAGLKS